MLKSGDAESLGVRARSQRSQGLLSCVCWKTGSLNEAGQVHPPLMESQVFFLLALGGVRMVRVEGVFHTCGRTPHPSWVPPNSLSA